MEKANKIKIFLAMAYAIIVVVFLWAFFSKFSINELTSFEFIKNNRDYLISIKEKNYFIISLCFFIITIIWVMLLGFGAPIYLSGGFIFGKWMGMLIVLFGLTTGATFLYIFANYFLKDFIKEKFSDRFVSLNEKFKKNEFIYFLIYRFVGGIPFGISNIIPTLFNIKVRNFFFGSLIGMIPQLFVGVTLGSGLEKVINENQVAPSFFEILLNPEVYYPLIGIFVLLIITILIKKFFFK
tara:strand:+ start:9270 stop:9986 length:717 start_codon:yes stop_codon:yes gene_type:complete